MNLTEKKSTYEDGPHGGSESADVVTPEGGDDTKRPADKEVKKVSEAFAEIFEGVELPEDFSTKAEGILEAFIKESVDAEKERLEEDADNRVAEIAEHLEEKFTAAADKYLDFVADRWLSENKVAVVSESKVATATALVEGIMELLNKHNIKIEESTFDRVAELEASLEESKKRYSDVAEELISEKAQNKKLMSEAVLRDVQEGMVLTDAEKLASLVEDFDYSDLDKYRTKVEAVKQVNFSEAVDHDSNKADELFEEITPVEDKAKPVNSMVEDLRRYMAR